MVYFFSIHQQFLENFQSRKYACFRQTFYCSHWRCQHYQSRIMSWIWKCHTDIYGSIHATGGTSRLYVWNLPIMFLGFDDLSSNILGINFFHTTEESRVKILRHIMSKPGAKRFTSYATTRFSRISWLQELPSSSMYPFLAFSAYIFLHRYLNYWKPCTCMMKQILIEFWV